MKSISIKKTNFCLLHAPGYRESNELDSWMAFKTTNFLKSISIQGSSSDGFQLFGLKSLLSFHLMLDTAVFRKLAQFTEVFNNGKIGENIKKSTNWAPKFKFNGNISYLTYDTWKIVICFHKCTIMGTAAKTLRKKLKMTNSFN